jgi:hypothetical protein
VALVLTADQIDSRRQGDQVDRTLAELAAVSTRLPFTRTVGDEFQGVLEDPASVVDAILILVRADEWHVGLGLGGLSEPLPDDPRAARGDAFLCARQAVEEAKREPSHLRLIAARETDHETADAEAVLWLLGALWSRRTESGWQAVDLAREGSSQAEIAAELGVSRQAVGQRLAAAQWSAEQAALPAIVRLLARADLVASA